MRQAKMDEQKELKEEASLPDDPETLCRRALGQALGAGLLRSVAVDGEYQELRFQLDAEPWPGPMQAAGNA